MEQKSWCLKPWLMCTVKVKVIKSLQTSFDSSLQLRKFIIIRIFSLCPFFKGGSPIVSPLHGSVSKLIGVPFKLSAATRQLFIIYRQLPAKEDANERECFPGESKEVRTHSVSKPHEPRMVMNLPRHSTDGERWNKQISQIFFCGVR